MSEFDVKELAANIRAARARADITQGELAEASGVNITTVVAYESGSIVPGADKVYALAQALGTTPNALMGWQPPEAA